MYKLGYYSRRKRVKMNTYKILIVFLFLSLVSFSQNVQNTEKPKIGLVLSGGGAKGLAHIGVLHVLEEAGIKPDYITGTSMGSIIGALYAMGYSVDEISEINKNSDWATLLSDDLPLYKIVMEEKYESNRYLFSFPIRNYKFKLPSGFIEGQQLESQLAEFTWPLTENENFDSLPIPFHCMSVDLISGKTIEHTSGNLNEAMRASMAIPTIIAPEKIDTLLLIDGGVTKNFPVQEARKMGADIIIGVYVGFNDSVTIEDMFSFSDILARSVSLSGIVDSRVQSKNVDFLITPDLKGLSSSDFSKGEEIEQYGKEAALKILPELKNLADSLNLKYKRVDKIHRPEKIKISNIEVEDLRFLSADYVIGNSGIKTNENITQKEIEKAIEILYGTQHFSKVSYALKKQNTDYTLVLKAKEKTRAFLKLAPAYENERGIGLATNLTLRNWGIPSSHFVLTMNAAENPGFRMDLTKYWGRKQRLMNFYFINGNRDDLPYYLEGTERGSYIQNSFNTGTGFKYSFGLNQQICAKGMVERNTIKPDNNMKLLVTEGAFNTYTLTNFAFGGSYALNTTDHLYFPTQGLKIDAVFKHTFSADIKLNNIDTLELTEGFINTTQGSFSTLFASFSAYQTIAKKMTLNIGGNIGLNSNNVGLSGYYLLGGMHIDKRINFVPLAGFNFGEIIAHNYALVRANMKIEILPRLYLAFNTNIAFHAEKTDQMLDVVKNSSFNDYYFGYNAGVMYNSPIGPIKLLVGDNSSDVQTSFYVSIGYPF